MDTTKTRKQGNAIMVTVPASFNIPAGVTLRPKLTDRGIFYEFVKEDDFFDFDENILTDLVSEGYEGSKLIQKFKQVRRNLPHAMDKLIADSEKGTKQTPAMSRKEFEREIDSQD